MRTTRARRDSEKEMAFDRKGEIVYLFIAAAALSFALYASSRELSLEVSDIEFSYTYLNLLSST